MTEIETKDILNQRIQALEQARAEFEKATKALEKEINEREKLQAKLADAIEIAHLGPWEYDVASDRFTFNDHFYKLFRTTVEQVGGYSMSSEEYSRRFVHPQAADVVGNELRDSLSTTDPGFSRQIEHKILYADGSPGYISVRFFIVKDDQGRTVKTYGVNQDTTERRRAENALRHRIAFEQLISKISSKLAGIGAGEIDDAITRALGAVGAFTGADRAYVFQFRPDQRHMDNTHEWCTGDICPQIENLQNIRVDKELPWFYRRIHAERLIHVPDVGRLPEEAFREHAHLAQQDIQSLLIVPMKTAEGLIGFLGFDAVRKCRTWNAEDRQLLQFIGETISHVLARQRTERALRESEGRWQFALEGAGDGIWDWNSATNHVFFSDQWKAILGYTPGEIGETLDEWRSRIHPNDKSRVYSDLKKHFRGETPCYQNEYRILCKDGTYKWILDRGKVIHWTADKKPLRIIGTHTDISDRKKNEEDREKLIARLKSALSDVKTLSGLLPICASCKKIRDDQGYWKQLEDYIQDHSQATFSHSICRECANKLYPEIG